MADLHIAASRLLNFCRPFKLLQFKTLLLHSTGVCVLCVVFWGLCLNCRLFTIIALVTQIYNKWHARYQALIYELFLRDRFRPVSADAESCWKRFRTKEVEHISPLMAFLAGIDENVDNVPPVTNAAVGAAVTLPIHYKIIAPIPNGPCVGFRTHVQCQQSWFFSSVLNWNKFKLNTKWIHISPDRRTSDVVISYWDRSKPHTGLSSCSRETRCNLGKKLLVPWQTSSHLRFTTISYSWL